MRRILYYTLLPIFLLFTSLWIIVHVSKASTKQVGYEELKPPIAALMIPGKTTLTEFFSYGCPACYLLEPTLEKWVAQHPQIVFGRIPSVFRSEWEIYAKAYYVAKHFGIAEKITPALFKAVQDEGRDLSTPAQMADFFAAYGVSKKQFDTVFNFAPQVDGQVANADRLFHQYKIYAIPSLVIDGKYLTNADMTDSNNEKLLHVIEQLTQTHGVKK